MGRARGEPNEIELAAAHGLYYCITAPFQGDGHVGHVRGGEPRAPSRSISPPWRSIRFRLAPRAYDAPPWGRTCGEPDEIKTNTPPGNITALFREHRRRLVPTPVFLSRVLIACWRVCLVLTHTVPPGVVCVFWFVCCACAPDVRRVCSACAACVPRVCSVCAVANATYALRRRRPCSRTTHKCPPTQ